MHTHNDHAEIAVNIRGLSRRFGQKLALDQIDFCVPVGCVCGLVGTNGAGKTTLIKHILGLYKPQKGSVSVLGGNPVTQPVHVLSQLGYLAETGELPGWMRVQEFFQYLQPFYPSWDIALQKDYSARFELDLRARIRELSKGQQARVGLTAALSHRPKLLLLDEPSSGLDPMVRRDILSAIVRTIAEDGRTVLFSSHLLDEVERVCDRVAMLREGQMLFHGELDEMKSQYHRVEFLLEESCTARPHWPHAISWQGAGRHWEAIARGEAAAMKSSAECLNAQILRITHVSLDEIFRAHMQSELTRSSRMEVQQGVLSP